MPSRCISHRRDRRWSFSGEFGSFAGWNGAVFHDIDGSVGGVPNSYIVIDNGIADDNQACEIKPSWNAAVCKGDFGRLNIGGIGGGFGGRGAGAARGGPGWSGRGCRSWWAWRSWRSWRTRWSRRRSRRRRRPGAELCRSFSAAMAGSLLSAGTPRFAAGTEIKAVTERRPCPSA